MLNVFRESVRHCSCFGFVMNHNKGYSVRFPMQSLEEPDPKKQEKNLIQIVALPPRVGEQTKFFPSTILVQTEHYRLYEVMRDMVRGEQEYVDLPVLRNVISDVRNSPTFERSLLVCLEPHGGKSDEAVFGFICAPDNTQAEAAGRDFRLCALIHSFHVLSKGVKNNYFKLVKLTHSFCNIRELNRHHTPDDDATLFKSLLRSLEIKYEDTCMGPVGCQKKWTSYLNHGSGGSVVKDKHVNPQQHGTYLGVAGPIESSSVTWYMHMQETHDNASTAVPGNSGPNHRNMRPKGILSRKAGTGQDVSATESADKHTARFQQGNIEMVIRILSGEHKTTISTPNAPLPQKHSIYSQDQHMVLVFEMTNPTCVQISILDAHSTPGEMTWLASTSINFNCMQIEATSNIRELVDLHGLKAIAQRVANVLKRNVTISVSAQRLENVSDDIRDLLRLMACTDLRTDMMYVLSNESDIRQTLYAGLDHVCDTNWADKRNRIESEMKSNEHPLINVTCKKLAAKPSSRDCLNSIFAKNNSVIPNATSAAGVAIIQRLDRDDGSIRVYSDTHLVAPTAQKCILFPSCGIPRLVPSSSITPILSTYVPPRVTPGRWERRAPKHLDLWQDGNEKFSHTYIDGEMCYFQHQKATNGVDIQRLTCVFESPSTDRHPPRVISNNPIGSNGSLVKCLLSLTDDTNPVYTRALSHFVLISAFNECQTHLQHEFTQDIFPYRQHQYKERYPSDFYRHEFIEQETKKFEGQSMCHVYADYSMFCKLLEDRVTHPNMFAVLVNEALLFPHT